LRCSVLCAAITLPHSAHAGEQPPSPKASAVAKDLDLVRRARQARVAGRPADATAALEAALSSDNADRMTVRERAEALGELGLCELAQRKYRDAAEHIYESLDRWTDLRPPFRLELQNAFNEAVKHVGRVYFALSPPEAAVLLDGRPIGRVTKSYVFFVEPGRHTVRARLNGYKESSQSFDIEGEQRHMITLDLPRAPEAAAQTAQPEPREAAKAVAAPAPPAGAQSAAWLSFPIAGGVLAVGAAVAGGVLLGKAGATREDLETRAAELRPAKGNGEEGLGTSACLDPPVPSGCAELADLRRREDTLTKAGWVTLGAAGALGVATVASFVLLRKRPDKDAVRVAPAVARHGAGLFVQGEF
jgi:hypothetical protein